MKNNLFRGVTTALITPFLDDQSVDYDGLRRNVHYQIENGVRGLLPLGTTGETPTLSEEEREKIVKIVLEETRTSGKPVRVMQGVGTNSTQKTVQNALQAQEWGVDALLVVSPYYNKPTQEGLFQHFKAVNQAVQIPIVLYNIKGRTGVNVETTTLQRISALENLAGVKEASGDINQMMDVIARIPELAVYSGDDVLTLPLLSLGGQGVISVVSNLLPARIVEMTESALSGDFEHARRLHYELLPVFRAAFIETNPGPIKYAMQKMGLAAGPMRLPLVAMTPENQARVDAVLERL